MEIFFFSAYGFYDIPHQQHLDDEYFYDDTYLFHSNVHDLLSCRRDTISNED